MSKQRIARSVPELDVLRGLAIVLMVVNHAGVLLLGDLARDRGPLAPFVFLGSFAPVVFFFATGFGSGLSERRTDLPAFRSTLFKAILLVVADQFMRWKDSVPWGLDFLGFIALSSVLLAAIAGSRRPVGWCSALIVAALLLRFGLGPLLRNHFAATPLIDWLLGVVQVPSISYAFSPWVVYPLLGFILARRYSQLTDARRSRFWTPLLCAASVSFVLTIFLGRAHATFFRWGTMSLGFFVLSIGVLFICVGVAWGIQAWSIAAARFLSLRGTASLAVVPIHYGLLEICAAAGALDLTSPAMSVVTAALVVGSLVLARGYSRAVERWLVNRGSSSTVIPGLVVGLCAAVTLAAVPQHTVVLFVAFVVAQLAITALLGVRNSARASPAGRVLPPARPEADTAPAWRHR